jgi:hypothetical protein
MNNYDFSSLNDKEFEELVRDLLNRKFRLNLQSFAPGKDKGIDIRLASPKNDNQLVVQVKHFLHSNYSTLKSIIKAKELPKINKLNPGRYILVTSQSMTPSRQEELKNILAPFVHSVNDIIGCEELNKYLVEFDDLEIKYFKLWFSSVPVLTTILNNAIEGRTASLLKEITAKGKLYVITKKLDEAKRVLMEEKLLVITGEPGIGKTTIASMLLLERAKNDFKVYKVETIREAEDVISRNEEEKQVFYFDDFLGANYTEIINANRTETHLTSFVERVRFTPNKYLIVTSRTVILAQAIETYEKIARTGIGDRRFEIKLSDYTKYEKALILYNHLYFQQINELHFRAIIQDRLYKTIVSHHNYSPRIIEFVTDNNKIGNFSTDEYRQFIINNLQNPREIWRYSFNNQIGHMERCFLLTLFTFEKNAEEEYLIKAFESRQVYEKNIHNQITHAGQFDQSIKVLLDGFISITIIDVQTQKRVYDFTNPSLGDFFIGLLKESFMERKAVIQSIYYYQQLQRFHPSKNVFILEPELQEIIRDKIGENSMVMNKTYWIETHMNILTSILIDLITFCQDIDADDVCLDCLQEADFSEIDSADADRLQIFMNELPDWPLSKQFLQNEFDFIIREVIKNTDNYDNAINLPDLFSDYNKNYNTFVSSPLGQELIVEMINTLLEDQEKRIMDDLDKTTNIEEVSDAYSDLRNTEGELKILLLPIQKDINTYSTDMDYGYWINIVNSNVKSEGGLIFLKNAIILKIALTFLLIQTQQSTTFLAVKNNLKFPNIYYHFDRSPEIHYLQILIINFLSLPYFG